MLFSGVGLRIAGLDPRIFVAGAAEGFANGDEGCAADKAAGGFAKGLLDGVAPLVEPVFFGGGLIKAIR